MKHEQRRSRIRRVLRVLRVSAPLAAITYLLVVPITALFVASWLAGYHLQVVESGSMTPGIPVGSIVVAAPVDPADVKLGNVVVFDDPESNRQVTHRVVTVLKQKDGLYFETKGDANRRPDRAPVPAGSVRGVMRWHVPLLGSALRSLAWPRGFIILVGLPVVALLVNEATGRRRARTCPQCGLRNDRARVVEQEAQLVV
jgi:signal peptidase